MLDALDAAAVRAWSSAAVELLSAHRAEIDALNVFPVRDSDTGANMLATMRAGAEALEPASADDDALEAASADDAGLLLAAVAAGAARAAAGNSGFILSQVLRGFADAARGSAACDAGIVAAGLTAGAALGRGAVVGPLEGTILTVARVAAAAATTAAAGGTLEATVRAAHSAAEEALRHTTAQLDSLARAGVVDAGGRGLVIVLGALLRVVTGEAVEFAPVSVPPRSGTDVDEPSSFGFEVQYLLEAPVGSVDDLRRVLGALGDSVVVVPVDAGWNVHVHVDDVGAAIEAGVEAGRPHRITVTALTAGDDDAAGAARPTVIVAVAPGAGLANLFTREGVRVVENAGDVEPPSVAAVVGAIAAAGVRQVVLLPNATHVTGIARQAAEQARAQGVRVAVVPTHSPVQGLAAIAVHDPARRFDDDVVAMAEAAAATRYAAVVTATSEALTAVGICQPGDILGLIDGDVVEIGRSTPDVTVGLVDRLLGVGGELMTVLVGAGAPDRLGALVEAHVRERSPLTEVVVYEGGQPDRPVIIGVE